MRWPQVMRIRSVTSACSGRLRADLKGLVGLAPYSPSISRKYSPGSAVRSPGWFRRFILFFHSTSPHPPSDQHLPPSSGHHSASHPSETYLSTPSAYHHPLALNSQPLLAAQRSFTLCQPEVSTYQSNSVHQLPFHLPQGQAFASTSDGRMVSFQRRSLERSYRQTFAPCAE